MTCIVRWSGCGGDGDHGVVSIGIFQEHPMSALDALRYIGRQSPSNNMLELGALVSPDAGTLDKPPIKRVEYNPSHTPYIFS